MTLARAVTPTPMPAPAGLPLMDEPLEMALLGGLLISADTTVFARVSHLTTDAFALPKNKRLWAAMQSLHERQIEINLETVRSEIGAISQEGEKHFQELLSMAGSRVASYSKILQEIEALRLFETNLLQSLTLTRNRKLSLAEKTDQISGLVTDVLIKASSLTGPAAYDVADMTQEYHDTYYNRDVSGYGISTGYPDLDALMNGFDKQTVGVIGAGSGVGKSILLQQLARNVNQNGHNAAIISLELPENTYMLRGLACEMQVDMNRIKKQTLTAQEMEKMSAALYTIRSRGLLKVIHMRMPTVAQLKAKITELVITHGVTSVGIDYVAARFFKADPRYKGDEVRFLADLAQMLTDLAKDLNIFILEAVQLTQESLKRGGDPTKTDFAGSGALVQNADYAFILKDETPYNVSMGFGETRCYIVKSRTGGEGQFVRFESIKQFFTFNSWRG